MLSEEKIRSRAKSYLKHHFKYADRSEQALSLKYIAKYDALVDILEMTQEEDDDLWEEVANEYYKKKEGPEA